MTTQKIKTNQLATQLAQFHTTVAEKRQTIGTHEWTYYTHGHPDNEPLLLLAGGGGDAETMFQYIQGFSDDFCVMAPNYPSTLQTLNDAVNGLRALLDAEGVEQCVVVGISFGAILAQLYIRRFQEQVNDLIITHTMIPSQHIAEALTMQYQLMRAYPSPLLMWMSKRAFKQQIKNSKTPISASVKQFWQAYFDNLYRNRLRKRDLLMRARLTAEYHTENEFNSRDLLAWHGNMLIIESEEDDMISDGDRGSLKAMYSRAYIQTLSDYDHFAPFLAADEIIHSMLNFLHKDDA